MVSVSVRHLFYQPMDEKIKTWTLRFPAKENPNMEKGLFDWPIALQYGVKAKYRLIFPLLPLFLFCSSVFILRSYENRSYFSLCCENIFKEYIYLKVSVP